MNKIEKYILAHQSYGFDELTNDINEYIIDDGESRVSKQDIKNAWNKLGLGFKNIPKTIVSLKSIGINPITGINEYELTEDFVFFLSPVHPIVIPKGFTTDFGSVPKAFHWIVDKDDRRFFAGFLVHDLLYATKIVSRKVADRLLKDIAMQMGANWLVATAVHLPVFTFGGFTWRRKLTIREERKRQKLFGEVMRKSLEYTNKNYDTLHSLVSQDKIILSYKY